MAGRTAILCLFSLAGVLGGAPFSIQDNAESLTRGMSASPTTDSKHVEDILMLAMDGSLRYQTGDMSRYDQYSGEMAKFDEVFMRLLSPLEPHQHRQLSSPSNFDSPYIPLDDPPLPDGGIFKRYQLFSTPLLVALLVVFFIIVPIIMLAVSALASIQSSVRLDAPKGYNAHEKKTQ